MRNATALFYCHRGSGQQTWKRKDRRNRKREKKKGEQIPAMLEEDQI